MKKLFKKIRDKIVSRIAGMNYIPGNPAMEIRVKELNIRELYGEVFISFKTLLKGRDYKEPMKSVIREVARKIGEELLKEGCLVINRKEANIGGIIISTSIFCARQGKPESMDELCEKIWDPK